MVGSSAGNSGFATARRWKEATSLAVVAASDSTQVKAARLPPLHNRADLTDALGIRAEFHQPRSMLRRRQRNSHMLPSWG